MLMILVDLIVCRADCRHCNKVNIKSLIIDGNRPELLRIKQGDALVELGNAHSQTIKDCRILEPRLVQLSCVRLLEFGGALSLNRLARQAITTWTEKSDG
jgi:hypothetical protein